MLVSKSATSDPARRATRDDVEAARAGVSSAPATRRSRRAATAPSRGAPGRRARPADVPRVAKTRRRRRRARAREHRPKRRQGACRCSLFPPAARRRYADERDRGEDELMKRHHRHEAHWVECAAEHEPDRRPRAPDDAVDGEGPRAFLGLGERHGERGERGGREQRPEDALDRAAPLTSIGEAVRRAARAPRRRRSPRVRRRARSAVPRGRSGAHRAGAATRRPARRP